MTGYDAKRTEVPVVAWVASWRVWAVTLAAFAPFVVLVGAAGWALYGADPVRTAVRAATTPEAALLAFLAARAWACWLFQRRRDRDVADGAVVVTDDASPGAIVTVASFSVIGVVAAALVFPALYTAEGTYFLLAVAVTLLTVPVSVVLLSYQLGEQLAGDRYRRGYRVAPAAWHYALTLPPLAFAGMVAFGVDPVRIPATALGPASAAVTRTVVVDAWDVAFVGVCAPTALSFAYVTRRKVEWLFRALVPT